MAKIHIAGIEYPIRVDFNSMMELQKRYGNISDFAAKMDDLTELRWILVTLINEGVAYDRVIRGIAGEELTEQKLGMLLTPADLNSPALTDAIVGAYNECLGDEKNLTAEELTKIAQNIQTQNPKQ